jgi:hypothetical protein
MMMVTALIAVGMIMQQSRAYHSERGGFTVKYPASWNLLTGSTDGSSDHDVLDLLSFPNRERAEGVVITQGGAEVLLRDGGASQYSKDDQIVDRKALGKLGICRDVSFTESRDELGPKTYERVFEYVCNTESKKYRLNVRFFEGDLKSGHYNETALQILKTLRETPTKK